LVEEVDTLIKERDALVEERDALIQAQQDQQPLPLFYCQCSLAYSSLGSLNRHIRAKGHGETKRTSGKYSYFLGDELNLNFSFRFLGLTWWCLWVSPFVSVSLLGHCFLVYHGVLAFSQSIPYIL
jgi:hypothetical protein